MPSECPNCHENAVNAESGEQLICHSCGVVVESRVFNFESGGNGCTWMSAHGTARFEGRYELPKATKQRLPSADSTVTERKLQCCLESFVNQLNLSHEIHNKTRELLLRRVIPIRRAGEGYGLARRRSILVGACLLIVCRQNNIQMPYRRMAQLTECNMFLLGRCVKNISKALAIHLKPPDVESLMPCILSELSVLDSSCEKLSLDLWRLYGRFGLSGTRNIAAKAATFVLMILEFKGMLPTKQKIAEVLGKNSVTNIDLRADTNSAKQRLLELAKEVPWIPDSVKKKDIVKHIGAIVDFHNKCGKLDTSVIKSPWMKKKEIIEGNRKEKIQMAKMRILDGKHGESEITASSFSGNLQASGFISQDQICSNLKKQGTCHGNDQGGAEAIPSQSSPPKEVVTLSSTDDTCLTISYCSKCAKNLSEAANDDRLNTCDCSTVVLIEELLKSGYSEEELMDGYFESRLSDLHSPKQLDPEGEREELDDMDIADREMHHYLWSVAEMERLKNLKEENMKD